MNGLIRALKGKGDEPAIEMLDVDTLKSRIGEPLPSKSPAAEPAEYVRTDSRPKEERSWRKVAGLPR